MVDKGFSVEAQCPPRYPYRPFLSGLKLPRELVRLKDVVQHRKVLDVAGCQPQAVQLGGCGNETIDESGSTLGFELAAIGTAQLPNGAGYRQDRKQAQKSSDGECLFVTGSGVDLRHGQG